MRDMSIYPLVEVYEVGGEVFHIHLAPPIDKDDETCPTYYFWHNPAPEHVDTRFEFSFIPFDTVADAKEDIMREINGTNWIDEEDVARIAADMRASLGEGQTKH